MRAAHPWRSTGLRLRVALALAAVAAGVGAITAVGSYLTVSHELRTTADATLSATAADVGGGPDPAGVEDDDDPAEAIQRAIHFRQNDITVFRFPFAFHNNQIFFHNTSINHGIAFDGE